jgi:hypothetical protein
MSEASTSAHGKSAETEEEGNPIGQTGAAPGGDDHPTGPSVPGASFGGTTNASTGGDLNTQEQANQHWNPGQPSVPEERQMENPSGSPAPTLDNPAETSGALNNLTDPSQEQDKPVGEGHVPDENMKGGGAPRTGDMSEDPGSQAGGGQFGG